MRDALVPRPDGQARKAVQPLVRWWLDLALVIGLILLVVVIVWSSEARPASFQVVTCYPPACPGLIPGDVGLPGR